MSKQTQKDAVYSAITSVLTEHNIVVDETLNINAVMTRELRSQVNQILFEGFKAGSIKLDKDFTDSELKAYISGLQSNYLRKDKRLNGGTKYIAQNPGSRVGVSDPSLKAMRALLSTLTSESDKLEVQAAIDSRLSEINALKAKKVSINIDALPASLRSKVI